MPVSIVLAKLLTSIRCVVALVTKLTKPTHHYEPRVADDSRLHCTFGVEGEQGPYACVQAGPATSGAPRLVDQ